jgi:hypothetical protein
MSAAGGGHGQLHLGNCPLVQSGDAACVGRVKWRRKRGRADALACAVCQLYAAPLAREQSNGVTRTPSNSEARLATHCTSQCLDGFGGAAEGADFDAPALGLLRCTFVAGEWPCAFVTTGW